MSYYLDTSAVVAALVAEPHSPAVLAWLEAIEPGTVFISDWSHTEVASALSLKVRTGALTLELRAAAANAWHAMHRSNFPTLAVLPQHFETAARFTSQPDLGLRAGDALHVAIAREGGHRLVTLDREMADAALQLGVPVERI
ncbi:type II toxin-antitoxin system VapC family toxin [Sphingomonas sp. R-74633]|uniref:type II toxin-antitoxin system VapC family toxin n=1 Tax=Sphingomonas sp. R-74633 TaxID=2751188 RepID=UPI0015D0EE96|nr:type II toxin-antitoxin system VapC family toxin [Sphingomonas sp. R-74633]NYT40041.1 type II toxin-antitoxin system VapC family toxin [Sphingomonas sp. R-74633]